MAVACTGAAPEADVRMLLAREVHDRIGSGLALVLRRLDLLERTSVGRPAAEQRRLDDVRTALADALGATRELVSGLRGSGAVAPPVPCAVPLEASLHAYLRSVAPFGAQVRLGVHGEDRWLPRHVADEVFVIVRESLRNALAHADARLVSVIVTVAPHEVCASVRDDGAGFDPVAVRVPGCANGLLAMEERAGALGGTATITSAPGRGTQIAVWIPINGRSIRHD